MTMDVPDNRYEDIARYALGRDLSSSVRLYFQHWMWQRQLGYLLHPAIPLQDGTRVADVACGTGIWLLDVAKKHPQAQLDGYDISSAQFPPQGWRPDNLKLQTLDILKPFPEHLRGTYDIVHVGLIVLVVQHDDPLPVLDNLLSLLKPGGYLQWEEADFGNLLVNSASELVTHKALQVLAFKVHSFLGQVTGNNYSWVRNLGDLFNKRDLRVLADKFLPIDNDIAHPWTLQHLMASVELIQSIDKPAGTATDWWQLYYQAAQEASKGASMRMAMISVIGQKPST